MVLGLEQGPIRLERHHHDWTRLFEDEKMMIDVALGVNVLDIQHIGGTSIPGMPAKPVLDIAIAVKSFEAAHICIPVLEDLGYEYRGDYGIPRRHYFVKGQPRTHHVHMLEVHSRDWKNHLLFRDYLTAHVEDAREFGSQKRRLATTHRLDREKYQEEKDRMVEMILRKARWET